MPLHAEMERSADAVEILLGDVTEEKNPIDGHMMYRRADVVKPETDAGVRHVQGDRDRARAVGLLPPAAPDRGDREPARPRHRR